MTTPLKPGTFTAAEAAASMRRVADCAMTSAEAAAKLARAFRAMSDAMPRLRRRHAGRRIVVTCSDGITREVWR